MHANEANELCLATWIGITQADGGGGSTPRGQLLDDGRTAMVLYTCGCLGQMACSFGASVLFVYGTAEASRRLHHETLERVVYAPMRLMTP